MIEFDNLELQEGYNIAKKISDKYLKELDIISDHIKKVESFLKTSGFGEFTKAYKSDLLGENIYLSFDEGRLKLGGKPLIESKVALRVEAYKFLADFLKYIAIYHGEKR